MGDRARSALAVLAVSPLVLGAVEAGRWLLGVGQ